MEPTFVDWKRQPRTLSYHSHYRWYAGLLGLVWLSIVGWTAYSWWNNTISADELKMAGSFASLLPMLYLVWLHPRLTRSVQIFPDRIRIITRSLTLDLPFADMEGVKRPWGSLMGIEMRDKTKWWFSASLERSDYLWEGLRRVRPELVGSPEEYESFRLKLVQYDHHEKRKEWFFQHRILDLLNWCVLPMTLLWIGWIWQSQDVIIHAPVMFFFRLGMFSLVASIGSAFIFSLILKRALFDRLVEARMLEGDKKRDMRHEGAVLRYAKFGQMLLTVLVMTSILKYEWNLFSVTRLKEGAQAFHMVPGKAALVDNRYNCIKCAHPIQEGDVMLFGRGSIGRVLAMPGEIIAQTLEGERGRKIASESVTQVPEGHVALQTGEQAQEVVFVKIEDLAGRLKKY